MTDHDLMTTNPARRICVFCGSSPGARAVYAEAARELGRLLAASGIGLVYGGGSLGLMGVVADTVLDSAGEVIGVIPQALATREQANHKLSDLRVVASMHERKALMAELSDAFIAMPGGYGTFEELFEVITWAQLGLHRKPIGVLNVGGYFDAFRDLIDHAIGEGFIHPDFRRLVLVHSDPPGLLQAMGYYAPPPGIEKVIELEET